MRQAVRTLLVAASFAALGCGDQNGVTSPDIDLPLYSSGDIRISISSGTTPTFTWSGGPAMTVSVDDVNTTLAEWELWPDDNVGSQDRIRSPVVYGSRPSGTVNVVARGPRDLARGRHYFVQVMRSGSSYGAQEFVP